MSELTPEQQAAVDAQKAQCPFCQIVEGKIPSKKVYEDDKILAILDIRPATKGHILVMPKEHYPIMPLIPPDTFKHMFSKLKELSQCVKDALLVPKTSIVIANGGAAGQQSAHFLMHLIPREGGDGLDVLDVPEKEIADSDLQDVMSKTGPILNAMLNKNLAALGYTNPNAAQMPQKVTKEQVLKLIEQNPPLKKMIIEDSEGFRKMVPEHPQLSQLFKEVSVDEIISIIAPKKDEPKKKPENSEDKKELPKTEDKTEESSSEKIDLDKIASMFK